MRRSVMMNSISLMLEAVYLGLVVSRSRVSLMLQSQNIVLNKRKTSESQAQ
jgi:hypothetical protein